MLHGMTYFADETDNSMLSQVLLDVARALQEDLGSGDLTAGLIDPARTVRARVLARESA
ncbi:nicotinate-nucleotide diphosphorylase (carboxylating), partial [Acidovorax sp. SRB_24]|nr:nicotinate-nucleotide diphosphorylase (carboxylating) [Acidovorax sp. SRB_24]